MSGMFANVQFITGKSAAPKEAPEGTVWIDEMALVRQGQLTGLYTLSDKDVAILRWIRIGKKTGNKVQVLSGLSNGEKYVVAADGKLYNGVEVQMQ
jgi:hypothetical protein